MPPDDSDDEKEQSRESVDFKRMLAMFSHELYAPIVHILALTSRFQRKNGDLDPRKVDEIVDRIHGEALLMRGVVDGARYLGSGDRLLRKETSSSLSAPFLAAVNGLLRVLRERGFSRESIIVDPGLRSMRPPIDRYALESAARCLLENSIRYARSDASQFRVEIAAHVVDEHIDVHFRDWGIGFDEGEEQNVFLLGFRGNRARVLSVRGQGLGLPLVRQIMAGHGGDAKVTSRVNPTEITMTLPVS